MSPPHKGSGKAKEPGDAARESARRPLECAVFASIDDVQAGLEAQQYVADRGLAAAVFLGLSLRKPLLLEGEAGVGKTEVGKVLASMLDTRLIRLQGYEGIDIGSAMYEWNYARQILAIRMAEAGGHHVPDVFSREFLISRPILQALEGGSEHSPPVLLIDELDRADDEFDAFLLEVLSDFQVTIPEIGTIRADPPPVVVITSNRTRELHDALKRRCLYHWIEYPSVQKEIAILRARAPAITASLRRQIVEFVQRTRALDIYKPPGTAETLDWARSLALLGVDDLDEDTTRLTLGILIKNQEDLAQLHGPLLNDLVEAARRTA